MAVVDHEIVTAGSGGVEALVMLCSALFREDAGTRDRWTDLCWPERYGREHFVGLISRADAVCLLALAGPTPVGYLAGLVQHPTALRTVKTTELQSMYVAKGYRSEGLGGQLVDSFCAWARDRGAERMSVSAYAANEGAIHFYERMGFRPRTVSLELGL